MTTPERDDAAILRATLHELEIEHGHSSDHEAVRPVCTRRHAVMDAARAVLAAPLSSPVAGDGLDADRAGVDVTFHGLRHGQTSLLVALGVHPRVIAERLGHASSLVSMDVYGHVAQSSDQEVARLLQEALG